MKVIYNILNPYGLGADRWVYEGYKHAFEKDGHEFFTATESDDFEARARKIQPDFIFLDWYHFMDYSRKIKDVPPNFFNELRKNGTKVFCLTAMGLDREGDSPDKVEFFKKYIPVVDVFISNYSPEATKKFKELYGRDMVFLPHAADTERFFPSEPDPRFACDIGFIGSYYTQKKAQFDELLVPLIKRYNVRIYGSGWTLKSKLMRVLSGVGRRARLPWLIKFANAQRVTISLDDERKFYASAKICVNIHEYYHDGTTKGFSNEREFKVPASGGFQISDYVPGMERYFELGREIVAVRLKEEWFEKIDYYLKHEDERKKIQEAGTARVLREHTYSHRVKQLMDMYAALPK